MIKRRVILITLAALSLSQCTAFRAAEYEKQMRDLRSVVFVGDDIHAAKSKIEGRYHSTYGPHDPTSLGEELWLHVDFGLQPTALESFSYAADIRLPFDRNAPISALIKADKHGKIFAIG